MAARIVADALHLPSAVLVTPNGIDAGPWKAVSQIDHTGIRVLAVQRLASRKRTVALVNAFARAHAEHVGPGPAMELVVVGEGPQRGRIERLIKKLRIEEQVKLLGRQSSPEIRTLMATCDFFVQPSVHESFGIAALEARTAGLPVIVRQETGTAEFIRSGIEGVQVRNDECLVRAIHTLTVDDEMRQMIASHNRTTSSGFDWPDVVKLVDEVYATVCTGRSVGS
jgi:glycosyltransferase involved in cell wall biosynthesis